TYNTNGTRATETDHNPAGNTAQDTTTTYTYPAATAAQPHSLTGTTSTVSGGGTPVAQNYSYDPAGNTSARHLNPGSGVTSDQSLTWNSEGKLAKVEETVKAGSVTSAKSTDYLYDSSGNRLLTHTSDSAAPAAENWTLFLGNTEVNLAKGAPKGTATRYYPFGAATAVRTDDNKVTFQVNDHHNTAELNIDATTGAVTQRRTTPFGEARGTTPGAWAGDRSFLGGTSDATGLTHLGARDYDQAVGRFISADPLIDVNSPQQINGYTYSGNNPVRYSDPSGLMRVCLDTCRGEDSPRAGSDEISSGDQSEAGREISARRHQGIQLLSPAVSRLYADEYDRRKHREQRLIRCSEECRSSAGDSIAAAFSIGWLHPEYAKPNVVVVVEPPCVGWCKLQHYARIGANLSSDVSTVAGVAAVATAFIPGVDAVATPVLGAISTGAGAVATGLDVVGGDYQGAAVNGVVTVTGVLTGGLGGWAERPAAAAGVSFLVRGMGGEVKASGQEAARLSGGKYNPAADDRFINAMGSIPAALASAVGFNLDPLHDQGKSSLFG
ncbi:RHS repeat-associated core domain-containing protein, partial [Kitasatospora sp. NPDC049258]|uniref:RHS repeat-associated core domain-containing protein n=1 Tax=Kitasatospora sp. NPDC049258 TaxID=3155394 RepID=UPI00341CEA7E